MEGCGKSFRALYQGFGSGFDAICGGLHNGKTIVCPECNSQRVEEQKKREKAVFEEAVSAIMRMYDCSHGAAIIILRRGI